MSYEHTRLSYNGLFETFLSPMPNWCSKKQQNMRGEIRCTDEMAYPDNSLARCRKSRTERCLHNSTTLLALYSSRLFELKR